MPVRGAVEGIDVRRVSEWFEREIEGVVLPLTFSLIAGGRSNLTFRVEDASANAWALRRPPLSHVLPTAHDMSREFRVISALGPTPVPVPVTYGLCADESVNDSPFYVMEFVEGHILRDEASVLRELDSEARRRAGYSLADTLAQLHSVDVDAVGLGDFAKRDGYIDRQLRRWSQQFENSVVDDEHSTEVSGIVREVHDLLAGGVPRQIGTAIVHGDFRLDNTVLSDDGTVRAVLDWEICTLGDPLADLGMLMVYWTEPGDEASIAGLTPTAAPGFASRADLQRRYREASGKNIDDLDFYVAFGYWKLACILQGVYARYAGGAAAGDRTSVEGFARSVVHLAELARERLAP